MKEILLLLVMFWNVENFFDTHDNPSTADDPFTPRGEKFWSRKKFEKKRDDIARIIMLAAEKHGKFPAIIGLCEVENSFVLTQLVEYTPLAKMGYKFIHKDSPDARGIDVALLYREEEFKPLQREFYPLVSEDGDTLSSRLVLYTKGVLYGLDTLHVFVNHWPSKLGGDAQTRHKRLLASNTLKEVADSILKNTSNANIIVMGDFNDTPQSAPVKNLNNMVNLAQWSSGAEGTHKYKESWELIDQFLVSGNLLWEMEIFAPQQLLQRDETYLGYKLRKTYSGPRYLGGISDHLPIIMKIFGFEY